MGAKKPRGGPTIAHPVIPVQYDHPFEIIPCSAMTWRKHVASGQASEIIRLPSLALTEINDRRDDSSRLQSNDLQPCARFRAIMSAPESGLTTSKGVSA
jgi:hypothetical protein